MQKSKEDFVVAELAVVLQAREVESCSTLFPIKLIPVHEFSELNDELGKERSVLTESFCNPNSFDDNPDNLLILEIRESGWSCDDPDNLLIVMLVKWIVLPPVLKDFGVIARSKPSKVRLKKMLLEAPLSRSRRFL